MTLTVIGKITMQNVQNVMCEKCGAIINLYNYAPIIRCDSCGASYNVSTSDMKDTQNMEFTFDFTGFQCMYKSFSSVCANKCPAPEMFCKEHTSDNAFKDAQTGIKYCKERLAEAEDRLRKMEESKKTWLIMEVSGLDEDDTVSKN